MTERTINTSRDGKDLYKVDFTPKGQAEKQVLMVWANSRLEAHNIIINKKIWGTQHAIKYVKSIIPDTRF